MQPIVVNRRVRTHSLPITEAHVDPELRDALSAGAGLSIAPDYALLMAQSRRSHSLARTPALDPPAPWARTYLMQTRRH